MNTRDNSNIAVFCDFENVVIGIREANYPDSRIRPILERLLLKSGIVVKKSSATGAATGALSVPSYKSRPLRHPLSTHRTRHYAEGGVMLRTSSARWKAADV